jgi:iron complex outermembrane receptor protein
MRTIESMLACGAAVIAIVGTQPAFAQQRMFALAAQPATKAVPEFARQAGIQIIVSGSHLRDKRTNVVRGEMDVRRALRMLIDGTGLVVASDNGATIVLTVAAGLPAQRKPERSAAALASASTISSSEAQGTAFEGGRVAQEVAPAEGVGIQDIVVTARKREDDRPPPSGPWGLLVH